MHNMHNYNIICKIICKICKVICKICNFFKFAFCGTYMQNMQNNMQNMQNMQIKKPICKICTAHVADETRLNHVYDVYILPWLLVCYSTYTSYTWYRHVYTFLEMYKHVCTFLEMYKHVCTWYIHGIYIWRYKHVCTLSRRVSSYYHVVHKYTSMYMFWLIYLYIPCTYQYINGCYIFFSYIHVCQSLFSWCSVYRWLHTFHEMYRHHWTVYVHWCILLVSAFWFALLAGL